MKKFLMALYLLASCSSVAQEAPIAAQALTPAEEERLLAETVYEKSDSVRVEEMLGQEVAGNEVLFYARQFIGQPYVGHTLEVHDPEFLVVNLRGLDCTTYVETVLALVLTHREGGARFVDYCKNLERIRYRGGTRQGYVSRLHYWTWWKNDQIRKGFLTDEQDSRHFTAPMRVNNSYMTTHPQSYALIKAHPEFLPEIARLERAENGADGFYLPTSRTGLPKDMLSEVHDGDVIGIVKMADGIDISHLGFAVWGDDGRLHLLNASSLAKRVVEDPATLQQYLTRQKRLGVRVLHVAPSR